MYRTHFILLLVSSFLTAVAVAPALAAPAVPPPPGIVSIYKTAEGACSQTLIKPSALVIGQSLDWSNSDSVSHTINQTLGFWNFSVPAGSTVERTMHQAGGFSETCDGVSPISIPVLVTAPASTSSTSFTVMWADSHANSVLTYSVQYMVGGVEHAWKTKVSARSATFNGQHNTTYSFRARTWKTTGGTDYSPWVQVSVG